VECPLEEEIDSSNGKKSDQEWISSSKVRSILFYLAFIKVLQEHALEFLCKYAEHTLRMHSIL